MVAMVASASLAENSTGDGEEGSVCVLIWGLDFS